MDANDAFGNLNNAQTDAWIDGLRMMDDEAFFATIIVMMEVHAQPQGQIIEKAEEDAKLKKMDKELLEKQANQYNQAASDRSRNLIRRLQSLQTIAFVRILEKNEREKFAQGLSGGIVTALNELLDTVCPLHGGHVMSASEIVSQLDGGARRARKNRSVRKSRKTHRSVRKARRS